MKNIFKIDCALYPLGLLTAVTGFGLHIAGHGGDFHTWAVWAYAHSVIAIALTVLIACHLFTHSKWCRNFNKPTTRQKHRITLVLTILAAGTVLSGLPLLAGAHMGMTHYKLGIAFTIFMAGHAAKRFHIIKKVIAAAGKGKK